jgi:anti-sigma B factor antagonist
MSAQRFSADVRTVDDAVVVALTGDVNALAEAAFEEATTSALASAPETVVLDFSAASYINSTGIALVVDLLRRARAARVRVVACGLSEHYREIFTVARLTDFMPIADDVEGALRSPTTFFTGGSSHA